MIWYKYCHNQSKIEWVRAQYGFFQQQQKTCIKKTSREKRRNFFIYARNHSGFFSNCSRHVRLQACERKSRLSCLVFAQMSVKVARAVKKSYQSFLWNYLGWAKRLEFLRDDALISYELVTSQFDCAQSDKTNESSWFQVFLWIKVLCLVLENPKASKHWTEGPVITAS